MYNYNKTQDSSYDLIKLAVFLILRLEHYLISSCGHNFKKVVSFDNIVHFVDEENIVTYVDLDYGIHFDSEAASNNERINRERKDISRSCEIPNYIPSNDQRNSSFDEQYTYDFLSPYNLWDMDPAAVMSLNHTNDWFCMSNQYPRTQLTKLEQTCLRCFLECERLRVRRSDCLLALHSSRKITNRTNE